MTNQRYHGHGRLTFLVTMATAFNSCGNRPGGSGDHALFDTLATGTVVVTNDGVGMWTDASRWSLESVARIGSVLGDDSASAFGSVWATTIDAQARIYVLDNQLKHVRVYDTTGTLLRTLGREGGGPGEFRLPIGMDWDRDGRLWVVDPGNARYTIFDTTGAAVRTEARAVGGYGYAWGGGFSHAGELYEPTFFSDPETGQFRQGYIHLSVTPDLTVLDTAWLPAFVGETYMIEYPEGRSVLDIPYAPSLVWKFDGHNGLWFGIGAEYRLYHRLLAGDTLRVATNDAPTVPVAEADRARLRGRYSSFQGMSPQHLNRLMNRVPAVKPAFEGLVVDDSGFVWVERPQPSGAAMNLIDVFSPIGVYLGSLTADLSFVPPFTVHGDILVGTTRDELNVQYVVAYRVRRRGH